MRGVHPRSIDDALQWQLQRVGSTAWEGWSWKFQRLAYGYLHDDRWVTAEDALAWFHSRGLVRTGPAARGALIWFRPFPTAVGPAVAPAVEPTVEPTFEPTVVGCSLGDGRMVGPSLPDRVDVVPIDGLPRRFGWTDPAFPFAR